MKKENVKITDRIKTFEDARQATGRPDVPDFSNAPEDLRSYFENLYKMMVISEALNEGWSPDWANDDQQKWYPWFYMSPSGFGFDVTFYDCSGAGADAGSRLCFKTSELAGYAGSQFVDIWKGIMLK